MLSLPGPFALRTWHALRWVMISQNFCNWSLYTSLYVCNATLSCSRFLIIIEQCNCCILFFNDLLMVLIHFVCKLLSNMRKQHIAVVSPEVLCLWLLTWKYYLIHPFLTDVIVIFSWVFKPIHEVRFRNELVQLILMRVIFSTTKVFYNISGLGGLAIFKYPADLPGTCPRFLIDGHNAQIHCIKGKWHDRRRLYL